MAAPSISEIARRANGTVVNHPIIPSHGWGEPVRTWETSMRREWIPEDERFFGERRGRGQGRRRSRSRARAFATVLGIDLARPPAQVLTVVGSKGKGTAATCASATLAAAGLRVGTLTSPGVTSNRERLRIDGLAIARPAYVALVTEVADRLEEVRDHLPDDGYLAPTGLFTLAALLHFQRRECEVIVLEAGMGGRSDEVSLLQPAVLAVTTIFGEHLGTLGESIPEIAADKVGAATDPTTDILTLRSQASEVIGIIAQRALEVSAELHVVTANDAVGLPLPAGLGADNATLGIRAAECILRLWDCRTPAREDLAGTLATVNLPGRVSHHRPGGTPWVVDCATSAGATAAALEHCRHTEGEPATVILCLGADKDRAGALAALRGLPVRQVRLDVPHLDFAGWEDAPLLDDIALEELPGPVLALGTIYFAGELLAWLGADGERAFTSAPPRRDAQSRSNAR